VARAPPDGYTIVLGIWNTHVANGAMYALSYDVVKDFEPIVLLADAPLLLVARKTAPANDLQEFIAWLRANPDQVSISTVGAGSPGHLLGLLLQKETGTRFGQIPYRGANPAMQDVVAGQIDAMFSNTATALPHVRAGSIKAFAVTAKQRLAVAPEIPTMDEAGLPGLYFSLWAGLFAPRGTPNNVIAALNAAAVSALDDAGTRRTLADQGCEIPPRERQAPEALADYQKAEIEKWWPIIKAANIKAE
jgi:tripartite-type tricarboxylate transporter receptor subunit TctC